ncbi:hypothetical protein DER46DRAFT_623899 [Fusarium sp. MPI-SDFR-AT-0072]|nr:hypothetical protein DER46DRAFT_623899 [Fusarium sp. MPI-SDFR-AT-0072]
MPQLFEPKAGQETKFAFHKTPTYLFRLYDTKSSGFTNTDYVKSPAASKGSREELELDPSCGTDLLQLPPREAGIRLGYHLWKCKDREHNPCNLMSWSSSLLFLLQYGLYRNTPRSKINSELSAISLIMIDTRDFPDQTFLRDIDAIDCFYPYSRHLRQLRIWRTDDLYFGEYLSQGSLDTRGKCVQMTMQQLIDGGLFTVICPALDKPNNNWASWARTVCNLRDGIRNSQVVDQKQIRSAIFMAKDCVGDRFLVPFALMLLGLRSQQTDDEKIANAFRAMFTNEELTLGEVNYDSEAKRIVDGSACMEELKRFQELMEIIRDPIATISEPLRRLSTNESRNATFSTHRRVAKKS